MENITVWQIYVIKFPKRLHLGIGETM